MSINVSYFCMYACVHSFPRSTHLADVSIRPYRDTPRTRARLSVQDVGYAHGSAYFSGMRKAGTLQALCDPKSAAAAAVDSVSAQPRKLSQETPHAPHKFTDLAQMVSDGNLIGMPC